MCFILPDTEAMRKRITMIIAQSDAGRSIEEIALELRVHRATILIYLHLADFACPDSARTTATRLLEGGCKVNDSSRLLIDEQPLQLLPSLAVKIGLNEAILIQQVHYWLRVNKQANRNFKQGRWWTYNTHAEWLTQFPFWSDKTLRRAIASLTEAGLLIACNLADDPRDRTLWYTIDYDVLNGDTPQSPCGQNDHMQAPAPERANAPGQNDHMGCGQDDHMQPAQCDQMQASHLTTCLRGAETPQRVLQRLTQKRQQQRNPRRRKRR